MSESVKKVELSERMSAIARMVPTGGRIADVGCDHGFVSIYLIQNNVAEYVLAMDINKGPLERAKEHVEAYGLEKYIELRLSDGLSKVTQEDRIDTVVIAGMGGLLMVKIISEALARGIKIPTFVLQPQSDWAGLRSFLKQNEYIVVEENMVLEDGKYYPMMRAVFQEKPLEDVDYESELADAFGPCLLAAKHPVLLSYLQKEIGKFEQILQTMESKQSDDTKVQKKLEFLKKAEALF